MDNNTCIRLQADKVQISRCKDSVANLHDTFEHLSNGLALAGNPVRLKILYLLFEEERLCVCDLSDILLMKVSAVSQHLRKLKDRNLIQSEREAQTIYYSLSTTYQQVLYPVFHILDENKKMETV